MGSHSHSDVGDLLNRARQGDIAARDRLFQLCQAWVRCLARSHVESWIQARVDSSDLVQQTLMEAHQAFESFDGQSEGEWLAWLRRILKHNATDFVRQHGAARRRASLEVAIRGGGESSLFRPAAVAELSDRFGETPSEILCRREQELHLATALESLSEDYRQVITLRNLQRLPFEDVARQMNRSRPATQMLWMRAMKKLQAALSDTSG